MPPFGSGNGSVRQQINRIQGTRKTMNPMRSAFNQAALNYNKKQRNQANKNQYMYNRALYLIRSRAKPELKHQNRTRKLINNGRRNQNRNNNNI